MLPDLETHWRLFADWSESWDRDPLHSTTKNVAEFLAIFPATIGTQAKHIRAIRLRAAWRCAVHVAQMSSNLLLAIVVTRVPVSMSNIVFRGHAGSGPVVEVDMAPGSWALAQVALRFA